MLTGISFSGIYLANQALPGSTQGLLPHVSCFRCIIQQEFAADEQDLLCCQWRRMLLHLAKQTIYLPKRFQQTSSSLTVFIFLAMLSFFLMIFWSPS